MSLPEDAFTHTEADAARYERERAIDAGEDDRPTWADVWDGISIDGAVHDVWCEVNGCRCGRCRCTCP